MENDVYNGILNGLKQKGITLRQVSDDIGIDYSYLSSMKGYRKASAAVIRKVVAYAATHGVLVDTISPEIVVSEPGKEYSSSDNTSTYVSLRIKLVNNKVAGVEW